TVARLDLGRQHHDESYARVEIGCEDPAVLQRILMRLQIHGVNLVDPGEAGLRPAEKGRVVAQDFVSPTNLENRVPLGGTGVAVRRPETDCGVRVGDGGVRTVRDAEVRAGDLVVCGASGVRVVLPPAEDSEAELFGFMSSDVSSERPQALQVRLIADQMRAVKGAGKRVLWVAGPAIVHTGAAPAMTALVRAGYVDVLFAGNALATHDIEAALYGTSLGVDLSHGRGVAHGHEHHIRALNTTRRCGSRPTAGKGGGLHRWGVRPAV